MFRALVQSNTRSMTCKWKAGTLPHQAYEVSTSEPNEEESSASEESDSEFEDIPEYDTDSTDEEEQAADSIANVGFMTRVGRQVKTPKRLLE